MRYTNRGYLKQTAWSNECLQQQENLQIPGVFMRLLNEQLCGILKNILHCITSISYL